MPLYYHSDYALNKKTESIAYRLADGTVVEITLEDYLSQNPHLSEEQFYELKELSDEMYKGEMNGDKQSNRIVKKQSNDKSKVIVQQSQDDILIEEEEKAKIRAVTNQLLSSGKLTKIQARRFKAHYFQGLSHRQIALKEGVDHSSVRESLQAARKKLKKFY